VNLLVWVFGPDGDPHAGPILMALTGMALVGACAVVMRGAIKMLRGRTRSSRVVVGDDS
jgi:hypothetical protein